LNSDFVIAVHSLVLLAHRPEGMATSEEIADNVCTNPVRVRKVMSCLRKSGFVDTREGSGGGYKLCRAPDDVTLADVYRALAAGSLAPNWCSGDPQKDCVVSSNMAEVMASVFCEADRQLEAYFAKITIGSMLSSVKARQQA
jgi:Rrf2 family protein